MVIYEKSPSFMMKTQNKLGVQECIPNFIESHYVRQEQLPLKLGKDGNLSQ
jgi:hypothetical protein